MFMFDFIRRGIASAVVAGFNDGLQSLRTLTEEAQAARDRKESADVIEAEAREVLALPVKKGK